MSKKKNRTSVPKAQPIPTQKRFPLVAKFAIGVLGIGLVLYLWQPPSPVNTPTAPEPTATEMPTSVPTAVPTIVHTYQPMQKERTKVANQALESAAKLAETSKVPEAIAVTKFVREHSQVCYPSSEQGSTPFLPIKKDGVRLVPVLSSDSTVGGVWAKFHTEPNTSQFLPPYEGEREPTIILGTLEGNDFWQAISLVHESHHLMTWKKNPTQAFRTPENRLADEVLAYRLEHMVITALKGKAYTDVRDWLMSWLEKAAQTDNTDLTKLLLTNRRFPASLTWRLDVPFGSNQTEFEQQQRNSLLFLDSAFQLFDRHCSPEVAESNKRELIKVVYQSDGLIK